MTRIYSLPKSNSPKNIIGLYLSGKLKIKYSKPAALISGTKQEDMHNPQIITIPNKSNSCTTTLLPVHELKATHTILHLIHNRLNVFNQKEQTFAWQKSELLYTNSILLIDRGHSTGMHT